MIELLGTKLFTPRSRKNLISRPRLVERLNAGLDRKLTLITAPAGFGKTTLLSEWIPESPRCVTWLSLDDGDNDPTKFWAYLISSLQGLRTELGGSALALLQSPQAPPITSILTALINDLTAFPDVFAIVLDDYHVIESQSIHEALTFLIDHLPPNMHLVMTTRVDPPLPLTRLRARDKLIEIRANDLRFKADEAAAFLNQVMGLNLSTKEIVALEERTEGWIAGLQIAALSMKGHDDISEFIRAFSGSHRHILGYLADEVINQRPKGTMNFLLQTSILNRLCGPLCDAVTGGSGGQAILENLEHANLFITPLDDEGRWYRYHHLFAEVLRARLKEVQGDQTLELHRRAGDWFAQQGYMEESVRHALTGANFEEAANLIEHLAGDMLRKGSSSSLMRWLDAMPDEIIRIRPRLCLARAWTFHWGPELRLDSADEWAQLALQTAMSNESPDSELIGEVAAVQALVAGSRGDRARSRELSLQALDNLPIESKWRSVTFFCLGFAHLGFGETAAAARTFGEALILSQADGVRYIQLASASFLADIQVLQGQLGRAMELYQQVLAWVDNGIPQKGGVMAHGGLANILCEQDKFDDALAHILLGTNQLDHVGGAWAASTLYRVRARVQQALGNWADAIDILNQLYQIGQSAGVMPVVTQTAAVRAHMHLAQGDLGAAEVWAATSGLDSNDQEASHPGLREVEYLSYARILDAQGRWTEALSLLERLLQSAQTEERHGNAIAILAIQAMVYQAQGNTSRALECMECALTLAEPEGFVRTFVDEGKPMRLLLLDYQSEIKKQIGDGVDSESLRLLKYTDKLLAAFSETTSVKRPKQNAIPEPLSERELEVLRLISTGRSNQEIADILIIAMSTVKSHINSIYGKLGTNRRTQAIVIARDAGLLSE